MLVLNIVLADEIVDKYLERNVLDLLGGRQVFYREFGVWIDKCVCQHLDIVLYHPVVDCLLVEVCPDG